MSPWSKIRVWSKVALFVIVGAGLISFLLLNRNAHIEPQLDLIFKTYDHPNVLLVLFLTSVFSIFGWWLFRTIFKTLRQIREMRSRARLERAVRLQEELAAKAAKVQRHAEKGE